MKNPLRASLFVVIAGWLIGFVSVFPIALLKGRLSSHEFLVGEVEVEETIDGVRWSRLLPPCTVLPESWKLTPGRLPDEAFRIVFVGERVRLYDPQPVLEKIFSSEFRFRGPHLKWYGEIFCSRTDDLGSGCTARIDELLAHKELPSELAVAHALLTSLDRAESHGSWFALAFEFQSQTEQVLIATKKAISNPRVRSDVQRADYPPIAFRAPSKDEAEFLRVALDHAGPDGRLTLPPIARPSEIDRRWHGNALLPPSPVVLRWDELIGDPDCYLSAWSSVFRGGVAQRFAFVGLVSSFLSLLGFWGYRWRSGLLRLAQRSASGLSSRASSIDKFMSDPTTRDRK